MGRRTQFTLTVKGLICTTPLTACCAQGKTGTDKKARPARTRQDWDKKERPAQTRRQDWHGQAHTYQPTHSHRNGRMKRNKRTLLDGAFLGVYLLRFLFRHLLESGKLHHRWVVVAWTKAKHSDTQQDANTSLHFITLENVNTSLHFITLEDVNTSLHCRTWTLHYTARWNRLLMQLWQTHCLKWALNCWTTLLWQTAHTIIFKSSQRHQVSKQLGALCPVNQKGTGKEKKKKLKSRWSKFG